MNPLLIRRHEMMAQSVEKPEIHTYLVFDGTAYIDTDIIVPDNASFYVPLGYETQKKSQRYFVITCTNNAYVGVTLTSNTNNTNRYIGAFYGTTGVVTSRTMSWNTKAFSLFLTPKRLGWGTTSYQITRGSETPTGTMVFGSINTHTGNPFTGKMPIFRIYGSDAQNVSSYTQFSNYTPIYTFRPCVYKGEAGFWCVENSRFYGNTAGAGTLTVGD